MLVVSCACRAFQGVLALLNSPFNSTRCLFSSASMESSSSWTAGSRISFSSFMAGSSAASSSSMICLSSLRLGLSIFEGLLSPSMYVIRDATISAWRRLSEAIWRNRLLTRSLLVHRARPMFL